MLRTTLIKKSFLAAIVLSSLHAQAAVVENNSTPDIFSLNKQVNGTYVRTTQVSFKQGGKYQLDLANLGQVDEFTTLAVSLTSKSNPSDRVADILLDGVLSKEQKFSLLNGGDYLMTLVGVTSSKLVSGKAQFKVGVETVPLPSAVIFLSSALMGLFAFMRRKVNV